MTLTKTIFISPDSGLYDCTPWKSQKPTPLTSRLLRGLLQPESTASPVPTPDSDASQILQPLRSLVGASVALASQSLPLPRRTGICRICRITGTNPLRTKSMSSHGDNRRTTSVPARMAPAVEPRHLIHQKYTRRRERLNRIDAQDEEEGWGGCARIWAGTNHIMTPFCLMIRKRSHDDLTIPSY